MRRIIHVFVVTIFVALSAGVISWTAFSNQGSSPGIEQTFQKAKQEYLDKNLHSASEYINKGAAFMKEQAGKASAKSKKALRESADELEQLAGDVKQGLVSSPKRIEEAFARAHLALASNDHVRATQSWAEKKYEQAGDALQSANEHLEKSLDWAGGKIEKGTSDALKKSGELVGKLKQKGALISEEVGKSLRDVGSSIEDFAKRISPR
jgi:phospholipase/lecithinase/hemolysin